MPRRGNSLIGQVLIRIAGFLVVVPLTYSAAGFACDLARKKTLFCRTDGRRFEAGRSRTAVTNFDQAHRQPNSVLQERLVFLTVKYASALVRHCTGL